MSTHTTGAPGAAPHATKPPVGDFDQGVPSFEASGGDWADIAESAVAAAALGEERIVAQSSNDLFSVPRPSPSGDQIMVLTRRYLPALYVLPDAL